MTRTLTTYIAVAVAAASATAWAQPPGKGPGGYPGGQGRPVVGTSPYGAGGFGGPGGMRPSVQGFTPSYSGQPGKAGMGSDRGMMTPGTYGRISRGGAAMAYPPGYGPGGERPMVSPYGSQWPGMGPDGSSASSRPGGRRSGGSEAGYPGGNGAPMTPPHAAMYGGQFGPTTDPAGDGRSGKSGRNRSNPSTMAMPSGDFPSEFESAAPSGAALRRSGTKNFPGGMTARGEQSLRSVETAPGSRDDMVRPADGAYFAPGQSPSEIQKHFKSSSDSLRNAMSDGDQERVSEQLHGIRQEAQTLRGRLRTLPLEQRLHVPSISLIYDEGARLVDEGMRTNQESKVRMGMEKIEDANRRLGELEKQ